MVIITKKAIRKDYATNKPETNNITELVAEPISKNIQLDVGFATEDNIYDSDEDVAEIKNIPVSTAASSNALPSTPPTTSPTAVSASAATLAKKAAPVTPSKKQLQRIILFKESKLISR